MKRFFTLLELLVVIAVIGILASLLFPSLSKAREKARIVVEISNRKQLMTATLLYADDNSGNLPDRADSYQELHVVSSGGKDNNERLLKAYCGSKEYKVREAMFFCDSTLSSKRNQQTTYPDYTYEAGTVQYYNPPTSGTLLISGFDISSLAKGDPANAVWSCMALKTSSAKYFGHNAPVSDYKFDGASTVFLDSSAQWIHRNSLRDFYRGSNNLFFIPVKK